LRLKSLIERINTTYGSISHIPDFRSLQSISVDWAGFVGTALRAQPRATHPLKHLLLIALLYDSWEDFLRAYSTKPNDNVAIKTEPTPVDPRPAEFVQLLRSEGHSITSAAKALGVTTTTGIRWAKLNGISYTSRAKKITEPILARCRSQLRAGNTKAMVAETNGVSMTTITRLLSSEPDLRDDWKATVFEKRRSLYREEFKAMLETHRGVPITLLRKLPGNRYAWLYRHDKRWLIEHLPQLE